MPTDEERREAAMLCRRAGEKGIPFNAGTIFEILSVRFPFNGVCWSALADLIDPGDVSGEAREIEGIGVGEPLPPVVDRDALLSLADEMESEGLDGWASGPVNVGLFARRIREAVGA